MIFQNLGNYILLEWQNTHWLEITAVIFAVSEVLLAYKNKVLLYPAGIISTGIYIWIYTRSNVRLYADAALQVYYLVMSAYGWVLWVKKTDNRESLKISETNRKEKLIALIIFLLGFLFMALILYQFTNSNTPIADAFVSAAAWSGMWLLAKRKIENWIVLNISNLAAIPLLFYKHLPLTALLTVFLFIVAIAGYLKWKRELS